MKKWKCKVCSYVHTGDEPPDKCPVCGAPKSAFVEISEPAPEKAEPESVAVPASAEAPAEPAAQPAAAPADELPPSPFAQSRYLWLFDLMQKYHAHPIVVHIPNGLLPISILFIFLAAVFGLEGMARAAVYNMGAVALAMPVVVYTGWAVWQHKFNGAFTEVFIVKIGCAIVVTVTSWFLFIWLLINPQIITEPHGPRVAFFMINLTMLGAAALAGWYGGKLVFRD